MTNTYYSIGVDISKTRVDIFDERNRKNISFSNNEQGIKKFLRYLDSNNTQSLWRIVIEPSGGYEALVLTELALAHYPVSLVHAKRIRDFAKATGCEEKTDRLDARMLARYGSLLSPDIVSTTTLEQKELKALVLRRRCLVDLITAEGNTLDKNQPESVVKTILSHIDHLKILIKNIDIKISEVLQSQSFIFKYDLLKSVPGIGVVTASTLLALLPELGFISGSKISKLVGVASIVKESGSYKGNRYIQGGRAFLRKILYMATLSAIKHNSLIKKFYKRLIEKGKKPKVAIVAAMRKMIVILNGKMANFLSHKNVF